MERSVAIEGMRKLFGILSVPDGEPRAGVTLVHGWSGYRNGPHRLFVSLSRALVGDGVSCLRFDLSGRGDSEGRYERTTLDAMIEDARAAIGFLRSLPDIESVTLCGICSGANVALGAASLEGAPEGLVLLSTPLFSPQREALKVRPSSFSRRGWEYSDPRRKSEPHSKEHQREAFSPAR